MIFGCAAEASRPEPEPEADREPDQTAAPEREPPELAGDVEYLTPVQHLTRASIGAR